LSGQTSAIITPAKKGKEVVSDIIAPQEFARMYRSEDKENEVERDFLFSPSGFSSTG
jgi:hypothetical protein